MEQERLVETFRQYLLGLERSSTFEHAPYHWEGSPESIDMNWMIYYWPLNDFSMTLANEINQLGYSITRLESWRDILPGFEDSDRLHLLVEFINPLASLALNFPAAIKNRFVFVATKLCHQANRIHPDWVDELEEDWKISMSTLERRGAAWDGTKPLVEALGHIDNDTHRAATNNFRNRYHHRNPPRFEIGTASTVTKLDTPPGRSGYAFGIAPPIRLEELVPPLWTQHQACVASFHQFQKLVWEQIAAISRMYGSPEDHARR